MATFYIVLKIMALLAVIIFPLVGPKGKKSVNESGPGKFAVNENGFLEPYTSSIVQPHPVQ